MLQDSTNNQVQAWLEIVYSPDNLLKRKVFENWPEYKVIFIDQIAEHLYNDIQRTLHLYTSPYNFKKEFEKLPESEKSPWYKYAGDIPEKLNSLNLLIQPYKSFCRTCLIPYRDLEILAASDYHSDCQRNKSMPRVLFKNLSETRKRFYIELNHLIPVALKKAGYEIIRPEEITEISENVVLKFARTIHSRYQHEISKRKSGSTKSTYLSWLHSTGYAENNIADFDDLPEEIKHSNLDNAFQIPAKLLSVGYKIRPVRKGYRSSVLHLNDEEIETMARVEHIRWCWDKILHGWIYGKIKDERKKTHPAIIPYEALSDSEKEKDRELVRLIPALLHDVDYEAIHINPEKISKLPYALKPQSTIQRILDETGKMNIQIRKLVPLSPGVEDMVEIRNRKIEEAIKEIVSSYNYALHIQESFLPDNLYVRECFPDSFILFKPKDIVSGDFYFFSKLDHTIIFAAADCTGHGIPGALLSTIGYGILDQAVNELNLTDPPVILEHLYSRIHKFLKQEREKTGIQDDMDIAICKLNMKNHKLIYAGVGNPLYHLKNKQLNEYKPGSFSKKFGETYDQPYISDTIPVNIGDSIYLFSDGYTDQFGGSNHKKYQSGRLKSLLLKIQELPMPEQGDRLYEEIESWREINNEEQTDDILVIGIRI